MGKGADALDLEHAALCCAALALPAGASPSPDFHSQISSMGIGDKLRAAFKSKDDEGAPLTLLLP